MKVKRIITHPYLLIVSFLFILISGKHFGGFYVLYLLLALPHGGIHALAGVLGIGLLVFAKLKLHNTAGWKRMVANVTGTIALFLSLVLFFGQDKNKYNTGTFEQTIPQLTLLLFTLLATVFLLVNLLPFFRKETKRYASS